MKEHPIIFSGPMVQAILDGRKTQTRRVITRHNAFCVSCRWSDLDWSKPVYVDDSYAPRAMVKVGGPEDTYHRAWCRYAPGDRLWVREATHLTYPGGAAYVADGEIVRRDDAAASYWYSRDTCPSIHMPRWACRLLLEITEVRAQRVQEISEEDALAEGITPDANEMVTYRDTFRGLWDSLNAKRGFSWESNPWVWAITFRRVES